MDASTAPQPAPTAPEPAIVSADGSKITLGGFADAYEILQEFANQPLDGATAAKVVRLSRWGRPHYLRYIEARGKEAEKYGEKVAEGKYRISAERLAEYNQAMAPTRAEVIAIDPALKIDVRTMGSVKITPVAIEILEPLLVGM